MKLLGRIGLALLALLASWQPLSADTAITPGSGAVIFDFTCFVTKHCPATAITNSAGTEIMTSANPGVIAGAGTAGSASGGVLTVQGSASGTAIPVTMTSTTITGTVAAVQSGAWNITNITGTVLLPTGASTAVKQPALGTAGAASADVITVQGVASMTPLLINPGTAANWGLNTLGSTTSGQSGQLALGAVTTGAPSYTTLQSNALSLDLTGNLRSAVLSWAGSTLGAITTYGTAPGAVNVPSVNAFITNTNANGQTTASASSPVVLASDKNVSTTPYPIGATPYTATATGTTAATTATLAGAASVTTYLCGFSIRANATAAATGNATVTGVITATMNFTQWTAPNASGLGVTEMVFAPCIPASGANQSVAVVSAAPGTGGVVSVSAWGYKL